ncbi:MAG: TolC family protein [Candidatus Aureabacteria bacterium]|nr:TolC family protein [Candidatus Auribacterota bacterium]
MKYGFILFSLLISCFFCPTRLFADEVNENGVLSLRSVLTNEMAKQIRSGITPLHEFSAAQTLSLVDCLKLAVERSGKLNIAKQEYKLALENYKNSKRELFPKVDGKFEQIDGTTTGEDFRGKGYKLEMQYPLWGSGRIVKQFKQAGLNLEVARLKHDQILMEVLTETEKAYYIWGEAKIRKSAVEKLKPLAEETKRVAKREVERGMARDMDWLEAKILAKEVDQKIREAKNDLDLAELSMRQILDDYSDTPLDLETGESCALIEFDPEVRIPEAIINRPDIRLNRLLEKVNQYNKDIAKAESRLQILLDGYYGRRAENFISEPLDYQNEYYVGVTGSFPLGRNSVETQFIDQDSVPSAGQTTSTQFSSYNIKFHILNNKFNSSKLEALIKYYKAIEDSEKVKKAAIFEIGKNLIETLRKYEQVELYSEKENLQENRLKFQKIRLGKSEISLNDYLKEAISLFEAKTNYKKGISSYCSSVAELNKAIGKPGYYNPLDGTAGHDYFVMFLEKKEGPDNWWSRIFNPHDHDSYYPEQPYEDLKYKRKEEKQFFLWKKTVYSDPVQEQEEKDQGKGFFSGIMNFFKSGQKDNNRLQ